MTPSDLKAFRKQRKLTQRQVSEQLGISMRTIRRYELKGGPLWYAVALKSLT